MKYANDIVKEMDARGAVEVSEECFASEDFDMWMYGEVLKDEDRDCGTNSNFRVFKK